MTRKDYEAIATVLHEALQNAPGRRWYEDRYSEWFDTAINDFCDMFAADNPNFDSNRFREAVYA